MAVNGDNTSPVKKFVKAFDLTHVLPQDYVNKKYLMLLGGPEMHTVQDAVNKMKKLFDIQNIVLTSGDAAVPELENIQILTLLDDVKVQRKTGAKIPANRSKSSQNMEQNSLAYFVNIVRSQAEAEELSETSVREVSDVCTKDDSSSSGVPEKEDFIDFIAPPSKRKRIRKHRKRPEKVYPDAQNGNEANEETPEVEQQEPAAHALSAVYSLKDTYGTAPIFKKEN